MGCRWSEVQILSPRPGYKALQAMLVRPFPFGADFLPRGSLHKTDGFRELRRNCPRARSIHAVSFSGSAAIARCRRKRFGERHVALQNGSHVLDSSIRPILWRRCGPTSRICCRSVRSAAAGRGTAIERLAHRPRVGHQCGAHCDHIDIAVARPGRPRRCPRARPHSQAVSYAVAGVAAYCTLRRRCQILPGIHLLRTGISSNRFI